jgi:hypothetical protein
MNSRHFRYWHETDMPYRTTHVREEGLNGKRPEFPIV